MSKRWPDIDKNRHEFAALAYLHGKPLLAKRELQDAYPGWNHVAKDVWLYPEAMLAVQNWTTDAARANGAVPADLALISGLRAVGSTDIAGMMAFVEKGGDVDAHDETGRSLLQHAVKNKNPTMAYALISAGADVEQSNSKGWQPVHHAAKTGSASILYMLQKAGAALDARTKAGDTPLNVAANHSNRKAFRWLLKQAPHTVNEAGDKGYTPLLHVAYDGHDDMVETLLAFDGIELNAKTHYGETALHQAARRGNAGVVQQLLAAGADARILNGRSNSVLAVAKQSGNQALVELLQQQGLVLVSGVSDDAAEQSRNFMVEANRLYSDGEFIEATRVYRKAIDTYPRSKVAHIGLGLSLFMEKKHKPALRSIQTAIEIDPQDAELYYKAGRFAFMLGERALYMDYFARYLKMAPDTYNAKDLLRRLPELAS